MGCTGVSAEAAGDGGARGRLSAALGQVPASLCAHISAFLSSPAQRERQVLSAGPAAASGMLFADIFAWVTCVSPTVHP